MKRLKTGILFNIISLTLCLSAIVINVYSATVSQVNISGSLGYVKHESSFTVSFVKGTPSDFPSASGRFDFATTGYGTIKYQIDGNGTWVNLIQNDDLVSSISGVESSIQFRLTGKRIMSFVIGHYAILNNNKEKKKEILYNLVQLFERANLDNECMKLLENIIIDNYNKTTN